MLSRVAAGCNAVLLLTWGQAVIGLLITVLLALVGRTKAGLPKMAGDLCGHAAYVRDACTIHVQYCFSGDYIITRRPYPG